MTIQIERRGADSPFVHQVTRFTCAEDDAFMTTPDGLWDLVIQRCRGRVHVLQTGLITRPVEVPLEAGDEFISIAFKPGVFMPRLAGASMLDRGFERPAATSRTFWIDHYQLEIPTFENVEGLVSELARRAIIVTDDVVANVVDGRPPEISRRAVQRHFRRVLGLAPHHLAQIYRAGQAVSELERGGRAIMVAHELGYADQAHMIRSLKRIMGCTPSQIRGTDAA
jgi:hypothetical protein